MPHNRTLLALCALTLTAGASPSAFAQASGESGVRGRVVIAPELEKATTWPISKERIDAARGAYRVRRPSGAAPNIRATEPAPELMVVLKGVNGTVVPERKLIVNGRRFVPGQILVPSPAKLWVENLQGAPITVTANGVALATIPPNEKREVETPEGVQLLRLREFPFATATVRTLKKVQVLPIEKNGLIPPIPLVGAEYRLAFYHGAEPLLVRPLVVPRDRYIAIDASISKNRVVTVSIKNGGLQVLVPRRRIIPKPNNTTPPQPRPQPKTQPPPPKPKVQPPPPEANEGEIDR